MVVLHYYYFLSSPFSLIININCIWASLLWFFNKMHHRIWSYLIVSCCWLVYIMHNPQARAEQTPLWIFSFDDIIIHSHFHPNMPKQKWSLTSSLYAFFPLFGFSCWGMRGGGIRHYPRKLFQYCWMCQYRRWSHSLSLSILYELVKQETMLSVGIISLIASNWLWNVMICRDLLPFIWGSYQILDG